MQPHDPDEPSLPVIRQQSRTEAEDQDAEESVGWEDLPDPELLFQQMASRELELSQPQEQLDSAEEAVDPLDLFEKMRAQAEEDSLDPVALFEQMTAREAEPDEDLLDSEALFRRMRAQEAAAEDEPWDPVALFEKMRAQEAAVEDVPLDPLALFEQMRAREAAAEEEPLDPIVLFEQLRAQEATVEEELLDPLALFAQMRAREEESEKQPHIDTDFPRVYERLRDLQEPPESVETPELLLPDPAALFDQLVEDEPELQEPDLQAAPKVGLFDKIKAKFSKKSQAEPFEPAPLPDAAAMFEALEVEEQLEALDQGLPTISTAPLPALPDLDALRAELDAEMQAELEPDLLGDLSGPERFVDTVSDLTFQASVFPATPATPTTPRISPEPQAVSGENSPYQARREPRPSAEQPTPEPRRTAPPLSPPVAEPPAPALFASTPASLPSPPAELVKPVYRAALSPSKESPRAGHIVTAAAGAATAAASRSLWKRGVTISRTALTILTRQMAAMLRSGIPLHQSLAFCAESDPRAAPVLEQIVAKVESGYSLSNALKEFPESFDSVYVGLVHSGEMSGRINEMLEKLADVLERELELRKRLIAVVTYPAMLLMVSLLGTLGFIFFVLPQLMPLFADLKVELPWPTKVLLATREVLLPGTIVLALAVATLVATRRKLSAALAARPVLRRQLADLALRFPVLGPVYEKIVTSRVLYSLSSMLEVGVTMNQALARSEESAGNAQVAHRLARARQDLTDGSTVSEAFRDNEVFPNSALQLISAGEESARVVEMFNYVAKSFDEEVEYAMQAAAGYLEPLIMVGMGLVVGFITIAAAMPTIQLLQNFG